MAHPSVPCEDNPLETADGDPGSGPGMLFIAYQAQGTQAGRDVTVSRANRRVSFKLPATFGTLDVVTVSGAAIVTVNDLLFVEPSASVAVVVKV